MKKPALALGRSRSLHARGRARASRLVRALACLLGLVVAACGDDGAPMDPVDPCQTSVSIAVGSSEAGALGPEDCRQPDGAFGDRWGLSLDTEMDLRIDLTSPSFEGVIELQDEFENPIVFGVDGIEAARIIERLVPGSYIVLVRPTFSGQTGSYTLSVSEGPDCSPVGEVTLGETVTGTLEEGDCVRSWEGRTDNWALTLATETLLQVDLVAPDFDEIALVQDGDGSIWWGADWTNPVGHARFRTTLPAGEWTVVATSRLEQSTGDYELTVAPRPPCTPGTSLTLGEAVGGTLDTNDCFLVEGYLPADSFALTLDAETPVSFQLKTFDFDPLVVVRDQQGMDVAVGYDQSGTGTALGSAVLEAGTFGVYAAGYLGDGDGSYTLTVVEAVCGAPQPIAFGETVEGELNAGDCLRDGDQFQLEESWQLVLADETDTRIDLTSFAFDTWLILENDLGALVEFDDDGGNGLNSRIERTLAAGTYVIRASSFAPGELGSYTLSVGPPPATVGDEEAAPQSKIEPRPLTAGERSVTFERYRAAVEAQARPWTFERASPVR